MQSTCFEENEKEICRSIYTMYISFDRRHLEISPGRKNENKVWSRLTYKNSGIFRTINSYSFPNLIYMLYNYYQLKLENTHKRFPLTGSTFRNNGPSCKYVYYHLNKSDY
jgi:hypothetical protein